MNPVKSRVAIKKAYFNYGVRNFSLDTDDELEKIVKETNFANDLNLHLRILYLIILLKLIYQKNLELVDTKQKNS